MRYLVLLFFPLLLTIGGCAYEMDPQRQMLQGQWQFLEVVDEHGDEFIDVNPGDMLVINQDYSFSYSFSATEQNYTGNWELGRDDVLRFIYHQTPERQRMDRVDYRIETLTDNQLTLIHPEGFNYTLEKQ